MLDPDHYLCCTFWGSTPSPAPVPSMSHLTLCGGSTRDQDPAPDPYLCCTFWASPPSSSSPMYVYIIFIFMLWGSTLSSNIMSVLYQQSYIIFISEHFIQYFISISSVHVYISHNFYFSNAIFIALNDHLELTVLCRHSLLQRLTWYMFLLTIIGQFHLLLWTPFFFFFMYMADICRWGTNYTFLQLLLCKVFITIGLPNWGQFLWGVNSRSSSRSIFGL